MEQPERFDQLQNKDFTCELRNALYGFKQAPRAWYHRPYQCLKQKGFKRGFSISNLYMNIDKYNILSTLLYVDDLIFGSNNDEMHHKVS